MKSSIYISQFLIPSIIDCLEILSSIAIDAARIRFSKLNEPISFDSKFKVLESHAKVPAIPKLLMLYDVQK